MESQLEKTQKCVEDKHRISINIDAQSLQEINTEPQSVKPHKGLYPKLTKACTQNSQRRVPKTHKGLYPKLIIFHSLFVSLLTLLSVFSSQGRQCLFQLSISNRLCVSIQVMILCLSPRDASVFFNCLFLTDYVCLYRLWFYVYLPGTPVSFSIVYF
jgi:hypothetical protein